MGYTIGKYDLVKHHLLEIISFKKEDGTEITITNSSKRLKELGIYKKDIMCIKLTNSEHRILPNKFPCWEHNFLNSNTQRENCFKHIEKMKKLKEENYEEYYEKYCKPYMGSKNSMYGVNVWELMKEKYTEEEIEDKKKRKGKSMREFWVSEEGQKRKIEMGKKVSLTRMKNKMNKISNMEDKAV